jgi:hypothetical protein
VSPVAIHYLPDLIKLIDDEIASTQSAITGANELKPRPHLGASVIGKECLRSIWYGWRWASLVHFEGRMLRLFNRGHEEEPRFVRWFERIGAAVETVDPATIMLLFYHPESDSYNIEPSTMDEAKAIELFVHCDEVSADPMHIARAASQGVALPDPRQHRFIGYLGHFGGSLDGIATGVPGLEKYGLSTRSRLLSEFKTHNEKSFNKLKADGVKIAKPEHYMQMNIYREEFQCDASLYCAVNKNTDELYIELVLADMGSYYEALGRAKYIVDMMAPPPRIPYAGPSNFTCKWCDHRLICHYGIEWLKNCRTCQYAVPIQGGQWGCNFYGKVIPSDFVIQGCANHVQIRNE